MAKNKKTIKWKRKRRMVGQERRNRQKEGRERMVRERLERREAERKRKGIDGGKFCVIVRQYCYRFFFLSFQRSCQIQFELGFETWPTFRGRDVIRGSGKKMKNLVASFTLESINRPAKGRCLMLISLIETDDSSHANTLPRVSTRLWCVCVHGHAWTRKVEEG